MLRHILYQFQTPEEACLEPLTGERVLLGTLSFWDPTHWGDSLPLLLIFRFPYPLSFFFLVYFLILAEHVLW